MIPGPLVSILQKSVANPGGDSEDSYKITHRQPEQMVSKGYRYHAEEWELYHHKSCRVLWWWVLNFAHYGVSFVHYGALFLDMQNLIPLYQCPFVSCQIFNTGAWWWADLAAGFGLSHRIPECQASGIAVRLACHSQKMDQIAEILPEFLWLCKGWGASLCLASIVQGIGCYSWVCGCRVHSGLMLIEFCRLNMKVLLPWHPPSGSWPWILSVM